MTDNDTTPELESFLRDHPRLLGVLFGAMVLFGQVGGVAAGHNSAIAGP